MHPHDTRPSFDPASLPGRPPEDGVGANDGDKVERSLALVVVSSVFAGGAIVVLLLVIANLVRGPAPVRVVIDDLPRLTVTPARASQPSPSASTPDTQEVSPVTATSAKRCTASVKGPPCAAAGNKNSSRPVVPWKPLASTRFEPRSASPPDQAPASSGRAVIKTDDALEERF